MRADFDRWFRLAWPFVMFGLFAWVEAAQTWWPPPLEADTELRFEQTPRRVRVRVTTPDEGRQRLEAPGGAFAALLAPRTTSNVRPEAHQLLSLSAASSGELFAEFPWTAEPLHLEGQLLEGTLEPVDDDMRQRYRLSPDSQAWLLRPRVLWLAPEGALFAAFMLTFVTRAAGRRVSFSGLPRVLAGAGQLPLMALWWSRLEAPGAVVTGWWVLAQVLSAVSFAGALSFAAEPRPDDDERLADDDFERVNRLHDGLLARPPASPLLERPKD